MIIKSILDTDYYKLTMGQIAFLKFKELKVKYRFIDRNQTKYPKGFADELIKEIKSMSSLNLFNDEKEFLDDRKELTKEYIDFLSEFRYDHSEVDAQQDNDGRLSIDISGLWHRAINYEVSLMSVISELYFKMTGQKIDLSDISLMQNDIKKINDFEANGVQFIDMGSRRRYSFSNHKRVLELFKNVSTTAFQGTSNVLLAKELGIDLYGSMAHEFLMVMATIYGVENANKKGMEIWNEYYPDMDTFLPDTFTTNVFLRSYKGDYLDMYNTMRQDSGVPTVFADTMIDHYKEHGIDPLSKNIIFSDALNTQKAIDIKKYCDGKINVLPFGIGTFLTNNLPNIKPLNMVIKISYVFIDGEWRNAVKMSDDVGKSTGDINTVSDYKQKLNID